MTCLRPEQVLELLRALEGLSPALRRRAVLATAVSLGGSAFEGTSEAVLLVEGARARPGLVPLSELGPAWARAFEDSLAAGRPRLLAFGVAEDDPVLDSGLGAPGELEVLFEPVGPGLLSGLEGLREAVLARKSLVLSLGLEGPEAGRRELLSTGDPRAEGCDLESAPQLLERLEKGGGLRRTMLCPVRPSGKALVFGSGPDARALSERLWELGYAVFVADPRPGALSGPAWEGSPACLIPGGWDEARAAADPDAETAVAVMTHSFALDLEVLQGALTSPAAYVGQVGAKRRAERLLSELEKLEVRPRHGTFFAPAGLDLGPRSPAETALAVAAEICASRAGRAGGRASSRRTASTAGRSPVAGLILAAGRGKRFSAGNKLLAVVDGKPVLRHAVEGALAARLDPVIVVLGCRADAALEALQGLADPRLRVVFNPLWENGKGSSVEAGLREVPIAAPGVVSLLGDMPRVKPWLIERAVSELEQTGRLAFPVYPGPDGLRRGYPTAVPRSLFAELSGLTADDTVDEAVRKHWDEAVRIALDDSDTQADVDTPQDLELLAQEPAADPH